MKSKSQKVCERNRKQNLMHTNRMKSAIKNMINSKSFDDAVFKTAQKYIDKAVSKGAIKRGKGNREKAKIFSFYNENQHSKTS